MSELRREVERTRLEAVEEVEVEHRCPHCEQWFDESEVVQVRIGSDDPEETQLCVHCVELLFGFEPESRLRGAIRAVAESRQTTRVLFNVFLLTACIGLSAFVVASIPDALSVAEIELPGVFIVAFGIATWVLLQEASE